MDTFWFRLFGGWSCGDTIFPQHGGVAMNWTRILKWDLVTILITIIGVLIVALWIYDYKYGQAQDNIEQLENDANAMDSLLTSYQTSLASCRADRDTLAYAVIRGFESLFDAMPQPVNYVEVYHD